MRLSFNFLACAVFRMFSKTTVVVAAPSSGPSAWATQKFNLILFDVAAARLLPSQFVNCVWHFVLNPMLVCECIR